MCLQNSEEAPEKLRAPLRIDFVRVGGRYRVGELLGSGGSGEPSTDSRFDNSLIPLGSVYLGRDIRTGAEVALKIGSAGGSPSRLNHEYNVYKNIAGSVGTSSVLWYGKEGLYEVIVLEHLGNSLDDLINNKRFDYGKVFSCASQMVCSSYL